ncbi:MAG TPA: TonB family protein [Burkholderiales bacterium]|nr:TonB family protein [Burkholderiales bacterium]
MVTATIHDRPRRRRAPESAAVSARDAMLSDWGRGYHTTVERRLAVALAVSLAVHALAWQLVPPISAHVAPLARTLELRLVPAPAEPPAVEPAPPAPSQPVAVARKPRAAAREVTASAPVQSVEQPRDPATVAAAEPTAPVRAEPAPAILTRPAASAEVAAVGAPAPDILAGYGGSISRLLARYREYPRVALMRGWEGTVTMRLRVAPGGKLVEAKVEGSSGHQVLDAQAVEMVRRVPDLPQPPESLRDREFAVLVPVIFRLEH